MRCGVLAQSDYKREEKLERIENAETLYQEVIKSKEAVQIKDLKINGKDVISLGIPAGRCIGDILDHLLQMVLEDPERNDTTWLKEEVKRRFLN